MSLNRGDAGPVERVVLLGYMCCGKSSVGESLARRLNWSFVDFDVEIEHRENRSVRSIIEAEGEDAFREMEAALTEEISDKRGLVAAPGGGWITRPRLLDAIRPGTLSVWLTVSPRETVRRLKSDSLDRPFKDDPDPTDRIADMLDEREPLYRLADLSIPSDRRSIESLAFEIEQTVRLRNGEC